MLADQMIRVGDAGVAIAGGMENMSRPPYLLLKAREGYRHGQQRSDGRPDVRRPDRRLSATSLWACFADQCAAKFGITRQQQDDFAVESHARARKAVADKVFVDEIAPVSITVRGKTTTVSEDEGLNKFDEGKMRACVPPSTPMALSLPATPRASTTGPRRCWWPRRRSVRRWD